MRLYEILRKIIERFDLYDVYFILAGNKYDHLYKDKSKPRIFFLMQPEYGNLGDQAIAYATEQFFEKKFGEYDQIYLSENETYIHLKSISKFCTSEDIVVLQGGGNMGNLYPYIEKTREFCIRHIKNAIVVSMPTTLTISDNSHFKNFIKKSRKIYSKNKKLLLVAREKYSYQVMRQLYNHNDIILTPDIVFGLKQLTDNYNFGRKGHPLICLRKESEQQLSNHQRLRLIEKICKEYPQSFIYDTTICRSVERCYRELEVKSLLQQFAQAAFVITDRMHGMIFSVITKTPCVVLKSKDKKIEGSYEWIKQLNYVKLIDEPTWDIISQAITDVCSVEPNTQPLDRILGEYNVLYSSILELLS